MKFYELLEAIISKYFRYRDIPDFSYNVFNQIISLLDVTAQYTILPAIVCSWEEKFVFLNQKIIKVYLYESHKFSSKQLLYKLRLLFSQKWQWFKIMDNGTPSTNELELMHYNTAADIACVYMIHEYLEDILWSNIYKCIHDSY